MHCIKCGYDLSGTPVGGCCPECGTTVRESLQAGAPTRSCAAATTAMIMGILSLTVCGLLGPIAIVMYYGAKRELDTGLYAPASRTMAKTGLILGIISTCLLVIGMLFIFGTMILSAL